MNLLQEIKAIPSGRKELRNFGIVFAAVGAIIGGCLMWNHWDKEGTIAGYTKPYYFFGGGGVFLLLGLLLPVVLLPLQKVWMMLAALLGWVMTRLILSVMFFIAFTGMRCLGTIFGHRFLELKADPSATSYWISRKTQPPRTVQNYERQF